ncbi:MAG: VTT domain-containing protein [Henriciella sp.]|uniref:YqaA family protein n=1 Tax=Henriciella sp. TaxID=1968823 RepID=UPI00262FBC99|nr:VTT domain-containing protein [Henriciella sp.]
MSETAPRKSKKTLRQKISDWGEGPWSLPVSVLIGFIENTIVVVPMEPVFLPIMVLRRKTAWLVAAALLLGNVLGGLVMYWLGAAFADDAIQPLVSMFDAEQAYQNTLDKLRSDGFATLFMIGITPFPFQVGVAAAGAAGYNIALFTIAVTLSRSIRYFALAFLVMLVGERAEDLLEKHESELMISGVLLFVGFVVYFFFF